MKKRIKWKVGVAIKLPSYVGDKHLRMYNWRNQGRRLCRVEEDDNEIEELMVRANNVLNDIAEEQGLLLEEMKQERLIVKVERKKKRGKERKWVKWLGIILHDELELDIH